MKPRVVFTSRTLTPNSAEFETDFEIVVRLAVRWLLSRMGVVAGHF
jgi:hypothetical protein